MPVMGARRVAVADTAHASVDNALHLLGLDALVVPTAADGRFTADALRAAAGDSTDIATIVASAGSTNAGVVDDLAGLADVADESGQLAARRRRVRRGGAARRPDAVGRSPASNGPTR